MPGLPGAPPIAHSRPFVRRVAGGDEIPLVGQGGQEQVLGLRGDIESVASMRPFLLANPFGRSSARSNPNLR